MAIGALHEIVVDCSNPESLARFWQAMIGGEVVVESGDWVVLDGDEDGFFFGFQKVPEAKAGKNRIHFDVEVDDIESAIDQPCSTQSLAEIRTSTGFSSGHTARTAALTSSVRRIRFSSEPPYASVRVLESGERNSCSR